LLPCISKKSFAFKYYYFLLYFWSGEIILWGRLNKNTNGIVSDSVLWYYICMVINEYFKNEYLTAGNTYDNFIFEQCPDELLCIARESLSKSNDKVKSCVVSVGRGLEEKVEKIFDNCKEEFQKKILARDFVSAIILFELLKHKSSEKDAKSFVECQIDSFLNGNFEKVKELHSSTFMPSDISRFARNLGKIELSFVLDSTQNVYLQQAINDYIYSREPFSVKIFTNNDRLPSYCNLNGDFIECPHDYLRKNVNNLLTQKSNLEKEQ